MLPVVGIAAGIGLTGLASIAGTIGTIATVALAAWRIYALLAVVVSAFWAAVAYFAHDIFAWVVDFLLWMAANALEFAGVEDPGGSLMTVIASLPPVVLDLWAVLGVYDDFAILFSAYAMNFSLRSLPLIGGMFRG